MKKVILLISILTLTCSAIFGQDNHAKFKGWKKAQTEHFTFVYEEASREATEGFIKIADDAWNNVAKIYSIPNENIRVYVTGRTNTVNAYTFFSPLEIMMFTNPCTISDFGFRDNWQKLFFTHELIHAANVNFEGKPKWQNYAFGSFMNSLDFIEVNGWALEGLTTVLETELTNGGRGRSPYFEMNYKAPTLDNGFISYEDIGMEMEPPEGQAYVIGYLIMRSIADRYGIEALADIERNRAWGTSWEDAVRLVTGETAQDIYRDVRISLAKKYADERKIPEGIIISPRALKTSYYKPAIIMDDGTFIALRTARGQKAAVVRFDPSAKYGRNYLENTKPEEDLNTVYKETILFSGSFMDTDSITADENGNVYAIMGITYNDKRPGTSLEACLYKWNEEDGLKRVTKNVSLFQPSVSRDGKTLIAVEQKGMQMRLVKVDVNTGKIESVLEDQNVSFMQPNVNADGTKIAFLVVSDERARVAVMNLDGSGNYEIVANDEEKIYDPSNPVWNSDGLLTYTCNQRGRLETFEITNEGGKWISTPVISDPIGSTWAYKNDLGIYYTSKAGNGYVIKMKPLSEWGNVADFEGPSPAGEKICFGALQNDYPDFKPYTVLSEIEDVDEITDAEEISEESTEEDVEKTSSKVSKTEVVQDKNTKKEKTVEKPIPVKGKKIKHRSEEYAKKAEEANSAIKEIQNEKPFIPLPQPIFYTPFFMGTSTPDDEEILGVGGVVLGMTPKLQMMSGVWLVTGFYYPKINNFEGTAIFAFPIGNVVGNAVALRQVGKKQYQSGLYFVERNAAMVEFEIPFINRTFPSDYWNFSMYTGAIYDFARRALHSYSPAEDFENYMALAGKLNFDFDYRHVLAKNSAIGFDLSVQAIECYSITLNKQGFALYSNADLDYRMSSVSYKLGLKNWFTPSENMDRIYGSDIKFQNEEVLNGVGTTFEPYLELSSSDLIKYYVQTEASIGSENFRWCNAIERGLEMDLLGIYQLGVSVVYDLNDKFNLENFYKNYKFYFNFFMDEF